MTTIELPALTVAGRRRGLCELADMYLSERNSEDRPVAALLPLILPPLVTPPDTAETLSLFDQFASCRATCRSATATHAELAAADLQAELLLDRLVGEEQ